MFAFFAGLPGPAELFIMGLMFGIIIIPFWIIFSKAGFPGALSLLMLFPFLNVVMLFFLAFAEWPALKNKQVNEENSY